MGDDSEASRYTMQTQVYSAKSGSLRFSVQKATGNVLLDEATSNSFYQSGSYLLSAGKDGNPSELDVKSFWPFTKFDEGNAQIVTTLAGIGDNPTQLQLSQSGSDHSWLVFDTAEGSNNFVTVVTAKDMRPSVQQNTPGCTQYQASALVTGNTIKSQLGKYIRNHKGTQ